MPGVRAGRGGREQGRAIAGGLVQRWRSPSPCIWGCSGSAPAARSSSGAEDWRRSSRLAFSPRRGKRFASPPANRRRRRRWRRLNREPPRIHGKLLSSGQPGRDATRVGNAGERAQRIVAATPTQRRHGCVHDRSRPGGRLRPRRGPRPRTAADRRHRTGIPRVGTPAGRNRRPALADQRQGDRRPRRRRPRGAEGAVRAGGSRCLRQGQGSIPGFRSARR